METNLHEGWKWHPFLFLLSEKKRYNGQPDPEGHAQNLFVLIIIWFLVTILNKKKPPKFNLMADLK
jgi:hypothetical protein